VQSASRRSAKIVQWIQGITGDKCPPAARLIFAGRDTYLLDDRGIAEHLGGKGQLALRVILTDTVFAELRGRIAVLEQDGEIRAVRANADGWG